MDNFVLLKKSTELVEMSTSLGFTRTYCADDFLFFSGGTKKEMLKKLRGAYQKGLITIYHPVTEEMLRFALERTTVNILIGIEFIHPKDSFHFVRGGLDQVLCTIAAKNKKMIAFSFQEILSSKNRSQLLGRMAFNLELCKKYNLKTIFSNFSSEATSLRSAADLASFQKVLEKQRNVYK
ncbi:MAG: hypothetical protein Q8R37_02465 [Nanoarchaeota archaeon]|nr:hypothetical protein [Nanoarchaeota archaeon]